MRKSKALSEIRKRKRYGGLVFKPKQEEHPLLLAVKALSAFTEATILLMKTISEADDPNAMFKEMEDEGIFKIHQDTGKQLNIALKAYGDRIGVLPEPSTDDTDTAENE